jgi:hypothetical protein
MRLAKERTPIIGQPCPSQCYRIPCVLAVSLVGGILLGRGEDDKTVHPWQTTAAGVLGFIGCAMGRTDV